MRGKEPIEELRKAESQGEGKYCEKNRDFGKKPLSKKEPQRSTSSAGKAC